MIVYKGSYLVIYMFIIAYIQAVTLDSDQCPDSTTAGRTFILGILGNYGYGHYVHAVYMNIGSDTSGHVNITSPHVNLTATYIIKEGVTTVIVDKDVIARGNGVENKAFLVESDTDISIQITIDGLNPVQEGFMAIPAGQSGPHSFVIASYEHYYANELLVASMYNNTKITINRNGVEEDIMLQQLETYQIKKIDSTDLSGTYIHSNNTVSVFSGTQCSFIGIGGCQALLEQIPPISTWGTSFVVPPIECRSHNVIRIFTANSTAHITIKNFTSVSDFDMGTFNFTELWIGNQPLFIHSSSPIQVSQYSTSFNDGDIGDAFMMIVPSISHHISKYRFKPIQMVDFYENYLTITVPQYEDSGVLLNGMPIAMNETVFLSTVPTLNGSYTVFTVEVSTNAEYEVRHRHREIGFGAVLYAHSTNMSASYGYPLGMRLSRGGCSIVTPTDIATPTSPIAHKSTIADKSTISHMSTIPYKSTTVHKSTVTDKSTMAHTSTFITTLPAASTRPTNSTTRMSSSTSASTTQAVFTPATTQIASTTQITPPATGITCLACDDMTHVDLCDHVTRCRQDEVCYIEKYQATQGEVRFRSGCTQPDTCPFPMSSSQYKCKACCSSNYCNSRGCGESGLPSPSLRGPLCYDCNRVATTAECHVVTLCSHDQVCGITQYAWGDLTQDYNMGCETKASVGICINIVTADCCRLYATSVNPDQICPNGGGGVRKRAPVVCKQCCTADFCNNNCTKPTGGQPSIIG